MKDKRFITIISVIMMCIVLGLVFFVSDDKELQKETVEKITEAVTTTYEMSDAEIKELPTTEIQAQTEEQEKEVSETQATIETEGFEEQGEIAYNGTNEYPNVTLGDYKGLTYYSQIDSRWSNHPYTSIGDYNQTIGTSGCGPTCASMVVTAIKGTIIPPDMGDLFVKYGYRSANNGTYFSAFRFVADTFNIRYEEGYRLDDAVNLVRNNNYVIVSCANGLFTTGGHFITIVGIEGDTLKIYDPYLYAGKFETSTRRGKVTVEGNTVYVSIDNFRNYANYQKFFAFKQDGQVPTNDTKPVTTNTYERYVKANGGLRIRSIPNGTIVGLLQTGSKVTVYETSSNWSRIGINQWVCSDYLYSTSQSSSTTSQAVQKVNSYKTGKYRVIASVLNVRTGAGTNYRIKKYNELTANARTQNSRLGNYYTNGLRRGVITTVTQIKNGFGLTPSGWISLSYCTKL